jgi:hypothetical protein
MQRTEMYTSNQSFPECAWTPLRFRYSENHLWESPTWQPSVAKQRLVDSIYVVTHKRNNKGTVASGVYFRSTLRYKEDTNPVRHGGVLLSAPLHASTTLHNLLIVTVQIANKMGFHKKKPKGSKLQTNPLVREGVPHQETRNRQTENKNLVLGPRWEPDTKADWPTNRRS